MEPEGHISLHKSPPPVAVLSQIKPSQTISFASLLLSSHLLLNLPSGLVKLGFPNQIVCAALLQTLRAVCPAHHIIPYVKTRIIFGGQ